MKHLKFFWLIICLIGFVLVLAACGSSQPKMITVGVINRVPGLDPVIEGFKSKLTEFGYVEGKNIQYIYDGAVTDPSKLAPTAQKLVEAKPDVIFSVTTQAAASVQKATSDIPIIFAPVNNPVEAGLVKDLTHPGGNVTGITNAGGDPRRLQWLIEIDPSIKRVLVPYNPNDLAPSTAFASLGEPAKALNIELVPHEVHNADENIQAIANIPADVDAIFLLPDDVIIIHIKDWVDAAKAKKLPISTPNVFPGALTSFTFDSVIMGQQAARLADKILKGAKPADLPVENAEFFLTIDMTTAEAIGLKIPDAVLEKAHTLVRDKK